MTNVTFITGNEHKARLMSDYLGTSVKHQKIELDEIQSLDLHRIVEHKARQAFQIVGSPVLVEDVALNFEALSGLPGPFIKWFLGVMSLQQICNLLDEHASRTATAQISFAYFDGKELKFFDGEVKGTIMKEPRGHGFGWNPIFVPEGASRTYAEMQDENDINLSLRATIVYPKIKQFLSTLDNIE